MDTLPEGMFTITVPRTYHFSTGWGVHVDTLTRGENDDDLDEDAIVDIDVEVVQIREADVVIIGGVPCTRRGIPVENFRVGAPDVASDHHDLRTRWFPTERAAREHADAVRETWDNPPAWVSFVAL